MHRTLALGWLLALGSAQAGALDIYRCTGNPVVYTTDARRVRQGGCERMGARAAAALPNVPNLSRAAPRPTPTRVSPASSSVLNAQAATAPARAPTVVPRAVQQQRDSDRVQILKDELSREQARQAQLSQRLRDAANAAPAGGGDLAELRQALQRSETDVEALAKELALAMR
jgi:hypothetical protein